MPKALSKRLKYAEDQRQVVGSVNLNDSLKNTPIFGKNLWEKPMISSFVCIASLSPSVDA